MWACRCDVRGRLDRESVDYPSIERLRAARDVAATVQASDAMAQGAVGPQIGERLRQLRIAAIKRARS